MALKFNGAAPSKVMHNGTVGSKMMFNGNAFYSTSAAEYTNCMLNGSLENDFTSWTKIGSQIISTAEKKHGSKSAAWNNVTANYTQINQVATVPSGHKVYVSYWYNIPVITSGSFFCQVMDGSNNNLGYLQPPETVTSGWVKFSGIFTLANPNLKAIFATSNFTGTVYVDAVMAIDLTAKFDASIPTKAWCDTNITVDNVAW